MDVEALKRVNLVDFLSRFYDLEFKRQGAAYACLSPFTAESTPSFFVRQVDDGHWVFKDFSSGSAGSIFDFVQMKEKLAGFSQALEFLRDLLRGFRCQRSDDAELAGGQREKDGPRYDVNALYERFRGEDPEVCRRYLLQRKIASELVEELIRDGVVVHNRYHGESYCTFAVRDSAGELRCLDNHAVDGRKKFVLGEKQPFSLEWDELARAKSAFLAEGIIDYLSVKTLEGESAPPGLALLGNQLRFDVALLQSAETLHVALDGDRGGHSATLDLQDMYPQKELRIYELEGHKDPNELLVARASQPRKTLSPQRRLELYREFQRSKNKTKLAEEWGIDRSYLYEVVRDCEQLLLEGLSSRRPGRPPRGTPGSLGEAHEQLKELETKYEAEATKREELYCRSEFLALRLKFAEAEAAEARGEKVEEGNPPKKPQIKKKRKRKRSRR